MGAGKRNYDRYEQNDLQPNKAVYKSTVRHVPVACAGLPGTEFNEEPVQGCNESECVFLQSSVVGIGERHHDRHEQDDLQSKQHMHTGTDRDLPVSIQ